MSNSYPWAVNPNKLQRAIVNSANKTDAEIKALYVSYGGLLREVDEVEDSITDVEIAAAIETINEAAAPKKKSKNAK